MTENLLSKLADSSAHPELFLIGMGIIYLTAFMIIAGVIVKFDEHRKHKEKLEKTIKHPFSTFGMSVLVACLFPFFILNIGQFKVSEISAIIYFCLGAFTLTFSVVWHLWAKLDIGHLWSDGIEIKEKHPIKTKGAYKLARHPMYASLLLWCFSASLIMMNYFGIAISGIVILPLMLKRANDEEKVLVEKNSDYILYQNNVNQLAITLNEKKLLIIRIVLLTMFTVIVYNGLSFGDILILSFIHFYLSFSLKPKKVAFSYRSKSFIMLVLFFISQYLPIVYFLFYIMILMFLYGLKWDCPCMLLYEKYDGCPCFALIKKCKIKKK